MKKSMKQGHNKSINNNGVHIESIDEIFNDITMILIKKSLNVVKEYFINIPYPLNTMKDPYIKIYRILTYTVSNFQELKDIDLLTCLLFKFLMKCREEIQSTSQYCCKKLNKKPLINCSMNHIIRNDFNLKFKNYSNQDFIALSNILDYQWAAIEFLLQRLDKNYWYFRNNNNHIYPQYKHIS